MKSVTILGGGTAGWITALYVRQKFPDISSSINSGMTFGFKLKAIEDYLERETKTNAKGFRKTRRRQTRSKRRTGSKLRKSFRRRRVTRNKRM